MALPNGSLPNSVLPFSEYVGSRHEYYQHRPINRNFVKLETAHGPDRQQIVVKRDRDLTVFDLMQDLEKIFKIPIEEQLVFHKGKNICNYQYDTPLEKLGMENLDQIKILRDSELPYRTSPRSFEHQMTAEYLNQNQLAQNSFQMQNEKISNIKRSSKEVLKLYAALGSERENVIVDGDKPLRVSNLKKAVSNVFKIPEEKLFIVYRGNNMHEYEDETPLELFGIENNSPITVWSKADPENQQDLRIPRGASPPSSSKFDHLVTPRLSLPRVNFNQKSFNYITQGPNEVLKIEVQHGSDRHQVLLKGQNKTLTVLDLQNEIEKITSVPIKDQRVYFKAKELNTTPLSTLKECQLENNHVIKLVGEPSKMVHSKYFGRVNIREQTYAQNLPNYQKQYSQL